MDHPLYIQTCILLTFRAEINFQLATLCVTPLQPPNGRLSIKFSHFLLIFFMFNFYFCLLISLHVVSTLFVWQSARVCHVVVHLLLLCSYFSNLTTIIISAVNRPNCSYKFSEHRRTGVGAGEGRDAGMALRREQCKQVCGKSSLWRRRL